MWYCVVGWAECSFVCYVCCIGLADIVIWAGCVSGVVEVVVARDKVCVS